MDQSRRPPPWPEPWWQAMHLAFNAWNGDVQAARDDYDRLRAEQDGATCRKGLHLMTPENTTAYGGVLRCRKCRNRTNKLRMRERRDQTHAA